MLTQLVPIAKSSSESLFQQLAEIHRDEIPDGFLASLDIRALSRMYRIMAEESNAIGIAAVCNGDCCGFIWGAIDTARLYRRCLPKCGVAMALPLVRKLLFRPILVFHVIETVCYPRKASKLEDLPRPEILNFCVRSNHQGKGVGRRLFREVCTEFSNRGIDSFRIVTGESQESAHRFYESAGAVMQNRFEVHKGTSSRIYVFQQPPHAVRQAA